MFRMYLSAGKVLGLYGVKMSNLGFSQQAGRQAESPQWCLTLLIHIQDKELAFYFIYLFIYLLIYLFIYFWLCWVFVSVRGLSPVAASGDHSSPRYAGPSRWGAQAPDAQAQQLWLTGPVALRHVGSSQTRARTRVPCIGRQTLNHCATREARNWLFRCPGSCETSFIQNMKNQNVIRLLGSNTGSQKMPK